jgi:uncharacterized protein (DUF924 family)
MTVTSEDVLSFWFGDGQEPRDEWFRKNDAFDVLIRERFGETIELGSSGGLASWEATPRGRLALVIVLDQLSRNAFRDTPRAFAHDRQAHDLVLRALDLGEDAGHRALERSFLYMPLVHAEERSAQERSVALFEALSDQAPPRLHAYLKSAAGFARAHRDIVARFGRFPHRNAILGRPTTAEEAAFLTQPGSSF